jgi:hypothetical protein
MRKAVLVTSVAGANLMNALAVWKTFLELYDAEQKVY